MELNNLNVIMDQVAKDKGISKKILVEALEAAMLTAARKVHGMDKDIEAHFNEESGDVEIFGFRTVVERVEDTLNEITPADATSLDPEAQIGDSLGEKIETANMG